MRITWKCPKCRQKVVTLPLSEPAMHWCRSQGAKYIAMVEQTPELEAPAE